MRFHENPRGPIYIHLPVNLNKQDFSRSFWRVLKIKKALITGISGQDGFFLTKLLLEKGYKVHGLFRRNSQGSLGSTECLEQKAEVSVHWGDVTDHQFINNLIQTEQFDEVYHLAGQSFVWLSFSNPIYTHDVNAMGTLNIVEAIRKESPKSKMYFAATSELYGKVKETPQNEETPFHPRSPYATSKLAGFWTMRNYRESYNLFLCNGILFNHESEMRGPEFVTRKITQAAVKIMLGMQDHLELGNLDAKRDWGYAKDYVYGMWLILQHDIPEDFVLATNEAHSVKEFVEASFRHVGMDIEWKGQGKNTIGLKKGTEHVLIKVNPEFYRPAEVDILQGNYSKAKDTLGWEPKIKFKELAKLMVEHDLSLLR